MSVCVLLADGFEEAEALIPVDLLRRGRVEVVMAGVTGASVTGAHGITVQADRLLSEVDMSAVDMVFLPGGLGGVNNVLASEAACDFLRDAVAKDKYVAAICAGPTVLSRLGLIDGKNAICYPGMEDLLPPAVHQAEPNIIVDGKLITGEAAGSAFDLGLKMLAILVDQTKADKVARSVYYRG